MYDVHCTMYDVHCTCVGHELCARGRVEVCYCAGLSREGIPF